MLLDYLKRKKGYVISTATLIIILTSFICLLPTKGTFSSGVNIEGCNVSGLTREQAKVLIDGKINRLCGNQKLVLKYDTNMWNLHLNDVSFWLKTDEALEQAYNEGRTGNILTRLSRLVYLRFKSTNFEAQSFFDDKQLYSVISNIKGKIDKDAVNASVIYKNGNITVNNEVIGRTIDIDKTCEIIQNHIRERNFKQINLVTEEKLPKITYDSIKDITHVLGTFKTIYNSQDFNRTHNIKYACEKINGTIVFPGEIFSMNKALGPRTIENGYKEAPIIYKNELIPGAGGGVCQVTTTLYNAILQSKLDVIARTHHSMPLGYVEPGRDATIAEDYIDFKFQNNTDYPICINAEAVGNTLSIRTLGKDNGSDTQTKIRSEILEEIEPQGEEITIDNNVPQNIKVVAREAKKGLKVVVYRETYTKDGEMIQREKISEDVYNPIKAQVRVNQSYTENSATN